MMHTYIVEHSTSSQYSAIFYECEFVQRFQETKDGSQYFDVFTLVKSLSVGKQEAFDIFKRDNPRARQELDGVERNRLLLRTRYTDAKQLATELEAARSRIGITRTLYSIWCTVQHTILYIVQLGYDV